MDDNGKVITVTRDPQTKALSIKEEFTQGTSSIPATPKITTAPQGSTLTINSTNLRIFNGPDTIFHIPNIDIVELTVKVIPKKELFGIKKP